MNINLAHKLLGHCGEIETHEISKALGITITCISMVVCEVCAIANTKQKNTAHKSQGCHNCMIFNEKVYINLSFIFGPNQREHTNMYDTWW